MSIYHIYNRTSGEDMGEYRGETAMDAVEAMARDAGYASVADAAAVLDSTAEELIDDLDLVEITRK